jgi:hypothetical protein
VNRRLAQLLTRLYPRVWRERYGAEFTEFLQDCESGLRPWANIVGAALREHAFQRLGAACSTNFVHFKGAFARLGQFSFSHQLSSVDGLLRRLFIFVIWLADISAQSRHSFRPRECPNIWCTEYLLSNWEILLFRRPNTGWLVNCNHSRQAESEGNLANRRVDSGCLDQHLCPDPCEPDSS